MPVFVPNQPVTTREPMVVVERLPAGRHRFRLIVEDDEGNRSAPDEVIVTVVRLQ